MRFATLQDHLDRDKEGAVELAAELGFDGLECIVPDDVHDVGPHGMRLEEEHADPTEDELWSPSGREQLRERADARDVELPSLCPSFLNFRPGLTAADPEERSAVARILEDLVEPAADLGADVVLVPFFLEAEIESEDDRGRVARAIQPAASAAAEAGVTLAIENSLPAAENRALLDEIDSPGVGLYYDVGNTTGFGYDPAEELRELGDDVTRVHFKDGESGAAMLGEGDVEFEAVADALADIGYDDWIVLETSYVDDPIAAMERNLDYARGLFE